MCIYHSCKLYAYHTHPVIGYDLRAKYTIVASCTTSSKQRLESSKRIRSASRSAEDTLHCLSCVTIISKRSVSPPRTAVVVLTKHRNKFITVAAGRLNDKVDNRKTEIISRFAVDSVFHFASNEVQFVRGVRILF